MVSNDWTTPSLRERTTSDRRVEELEQKLGAAQRKIKDLERQLLKMEDELGGRAASDHHP